MAGSLWRDYPLSTRLSDSDRRTADVQAKRRTYLERGNAMRGHEEFGCRADLACVSESYARPTRGAGRKAGRFVIRSSAIVPKPPRAFIQPIRPSKPPAITISSINLLSGVRGALFRQTAWNIAPSSCVYTGKPIARGVPARSARDKGMSSMTSSDPDRPTTDTSRAWEPQCTAILAISQDFWDEIRSNCARCRGEGGQCLAEIILATKTERPARD